MRTLAIINPTKIHPTATGDRRGWPALRSRFMARGWSVTDAIATAAGHEAQLAASAARDGYEAVLAVGGDGTCHWVANGLMGSPSPRPVLGVVPVGTGNDFAAALGLPRAREAAVGALLDGAPRTMDVGQVDGRYFLTMAMVGFGGEVARQVNEWPKPLPGAVMYVAGVLKMLATYGPVEMVLTFDGATRRQRLFMVAAGNTFRAAGGMKLAPAARLDDGLLDIVLFGDLTKGEVLTLLPRTFSGSHVSHPKVEVAQTARLVVESETPLAVQADGEIIGRVPSTITIIGEALDVIVPRTAQPVPLPQTG